MTFSMFQLRSTFLVLVVGAGSTLATGCVTVPPTAPLSPVDWASGAPVVVDLDDGYAEDLVVVRKYLVQDLQSLGFTMAAAQPSPPGEHPHLSSVPTFTLTGANHLHGNNIFVDATLTLNGHLVETYEIREGCRDLNPEERGACLARRISARLSASPAFQSAVRESLPKQAPTGASAGPS